MDDMASFLASVRTMCARLKDTFHITATRYVPHSPVSHAPDVPSPLYPDRPIRPLPKRRLRSLLSPEVADAILYSPAPEPTSLFYYPYSYPGAERGSGIDGAVRDPATSCPEQHHACICRSQHEHAPPPETDLESDDEPIGARGRHMFLPHQHQQQHQQDHHEMNGLHAAQTRFAQHPQAVDLPPLQPKPPNSTSSSVDGYDSFENTKNKKKRKIPTPGSTGIYQNHLSAELANLDISSRHGPDLASPDDVSAPMGQQYSSPAYSALSGSGIGSGISGSGSGRLARNQWRTGAIRSPLGVSSDGLNAWGSGRAARTRAREWSGGIHVKGGTSPADARLAAGDRDGGTDAAGSARTTSGIIGAAIANAVQDTFNTAAAKDQENVSLLRLEASRKPNASNAQFTFTASSNVTWPGREAAAPSGHPAGLRPPGTSLGTKTFGASSQLGRDSATHGTQTNSGFAGNRRPLQAPPVPQYAPGLGRPVPQQQQQQQQQQHHPAPVPPPPQPPLQTQQQQPTASTAQPTLQTGKKTRPKRGGSQYLIAARERRVQQRYKNIHHPPSGDEIWICEFCEYESIFGTPPEALVRQYEINDLKERRRLEEKRRLLEKAKTKGRKGKKGGGKVAAKNPAANQPHAQSTAAGNDLADAQALGAQSDGYGRDEYYDGEDLSGLNSPTPPLPPPPPPPTSTSAKAGYAKGLAGGAAGNTGKLRSGGGEAIRAN